MHNQARALFALTAFLLTTSGSRAFAQSLDPIVIGTPPPSQLVIEADDGEHVAVTVARVAHGTVGLSMACQTPCSMALAPGVYRVRTNRSVGINETITVDRAVQRAVLHTRHVREDSRGVLVFGIVTAPLGLVIALLGAMENVCLFCSSSNPGDPLIATGLTVAGFGVLMIVAGAALRSGAPGRVEVRGGSPDSVVRRVRVGGGYMAGAAYGSVGFTF